MPISGQNVSKPTPRRTVATSCWKQGLATNIFKHIAGSEPNKSTVIKKLSTLKY